MVNIDRGRGAAGAPRTALQPTIRGAEGTEVTPVVTEEITAFTENDNRKHKTLCGETYVEAVGEDEWRITINGMVVLSQLEALIDMRPANNPLDVITQVDVYRNVEFDRFEWTQSEDMNRYRGQLPGEVGDVEEQLFEFTLQTRDDDQ